MSEFPERGMTPPSGWDTVPDTKDVAPLEPAFVRDSGVVSLLDRIHRPTPQPPRKAA